LTTTVRPRPDKLGPEEKKKGSFTSNAGTTGNSTSDKTNGRKN